MESGGRNALAFAGVGAGFPADSPCRGGPWTASICAVTPELEDLFSFLRFPSVSTDSRHAGDIRACAEWLIAKLSAMGLTTELHETPKHPVVIARNAHVAGRRTVMIYGHYDVQPVDPVNLWTSDPFKPEIRDGRIWARGATDNKGQMMAHVLGVASNAVTVNVRRMGGGFGGKETQMNLFCSVAAVAAKKWNRPVKIRPDRDDDMSATGKRHDFVIDYEVGFDDDGLIRGIEFTFASRCGMSTDLSGAINDRAMFHCDNAYFLENVTIVSHRCKTNTVSNTAFRGFGGPQGMFAIESVIDEIARHRPACLDMAGVRRKDLGHREPVLVELAWQFHEIARHRGAGNAFIGHVRQHLMQRVAEFMK